MERLRELFQPEWQVTTDVGGIAGGPGAFDQGTTGVGVTGLGDRTVPAALTTRVFGGDPAQICYHLPGMLEARQVAECGHAGHGHGELPAAQGLKGLDHRLQSPGCDLCLQCWPEALEPFGVLLDRAGPVLEDDLWRWGGADHFGEPPHMGRAPGRPTRIADIEAEHKGFATKRGGLEIGDGVVFHSRDRDGGEVP